jgi:hypothetical protein
MEEAQLYRRAPEEIISICFDITIGISEKLAATITSTMDN